MRKSLDFHDYVIKDGKFIGRFEEMYQNFKFPWNQNVFEYSQPDKLISLYHLKKIQKEKGKINIIELDAG